MMKEFNETQKKLIDAAIELFAMHGFKGTSIRNIAKLTGMTISNIYYYFGSKYGLLEAILEYVASDLLSGLQKAAEADVAPIERFKLLLRTHLDQISAHRNPARIFFFDDLLLSAEGNKSNKQFQNDVLNIYRHELNILQSAGYVKHKDVTVLAFNILGIINWHLRWYQPDGPLSIAEVKQEAVNFILYGLLGDPDQHLEQVN
jgi:AcrR family transcriptional regulator